jgi:2'-5' RNA ligase
MRLFVAVEFDDEIRGSLGAFAERVRHELMSRSPEAARALTWVDPQRLHLTLHFLGEIDERHVDALSSRLSEPSAQAAFSIGFGCVGWFPAAGTPRVVWLDISRGAADLAALHAEVGRRLEQLGLEIENRPFRPHLTLGRVKRPVRADLLRPLRSLTYDALDLCRVDHATLVHSGLGREGPVYTALVTLPLATT